MAYSPISDGGATGGAGANISNQDALLQLLTKLINPQIDLDTNERTKWSEAHSRGNYATLITLAENYAHSALNYQDDMRIVNFCSQFARISFLGVALLVLGLARSTRLETKTSITTTILIAVCTVAAYYAPAVLMYLADDYPRLMQRKREDLNKILQCAQAWREPDSDFARTFLSRIENERRANAGIHAGEVIQAASEDDSEDNEATAPAPISYPIGPLQAAAMPGAEEPNLRHRSITAPSHLALG